MLEIMYAYIEYENCRTINRTIRNMKKRLVRDIMNRVTPYMWQGGYNFKHVVFPDEKYYKPSGLSKSVFAVSGSYEGIAGFTSSGHIITDAYCGALSTQHLTSLCIEDLINLWSWVERSKTIFENAKKHYCS